MSEKLFLGAVVKPDESIIIRDIPAYHISNVSLDCDTIKKGEKCQVWIRCNRVHHLVATLCEQIPQVKIDLAIGNNEKSKFYIKGSGTVHLTGYFIPSVEVSGDQRTDAPDSYVPKKKRKIHEHSDVRKRRDCIQF